MSLVSSDQTWILWAIISVSVAVSIRLEQKYLWAAKMSALVIALLLGILLSNVGIIPTESPVYDTVWDYLVPLALPLLLFRVDLKRICLESGQMLIAFLIGAVGTVVGAFLSYFMFCSWIPELPGLTAMMTGTYIGGSVNFMALSSVFGVSGEMVSAATIADNLNMAIYFFVLLSIPVKTRISNVAPSDLPKEKSQLSLSGFAICIGTGFLIVALSTTIAGFISLWIPEKGVLLSMLHSFLGNKYLWITTVSVIGATAFPGFFGSIQGGEEMGTYLIYCFMFVIGAPASILGILKNSPLLLLFAMVIVIFNMLFTFAGGKLLGLDRDILIIASNANIGGPTTAASMAIAKGWDDLVGPALLIGSFGYVIGNYLGMMVGYLCS